MSIFKGMVEVEGEFLSRRVLRELAVKAAEDKAVNFDLEADILLVWWNSECRAFQMTVNSHWSVSELNEKFRKSLRVVSINI